MKKLQHSFVFAIIVMIMTTTTGCSWKSHDGKSEKEVLAAGYQIGRDWGLEFGEHSQAQGVFDKLQSAAKDVYFKEVKSDGDKQVWSKFAAEMQRGLSDGNKAKQNGESVAASINSFDNDTLVKVRTEAEYVIGKMLFDNKKTYRDQDEALVYFMRAAERGHVDSQFYVGQYYEHKYDYKEAAKWYKKCAENGDVRAQNSLAIFYEKGRGVDKNLNEAIKWYKKAVEQEHVGSMNNLGCLYYGEKNYEEARIYLTMAAEHGVAQAQNNLGVIYDHGLGVARDEAKAEMWIRKAAEQGDEMGMRNLRAIEFRKYMRGE